MKNNKTITVRKIDGSKEVRVTENLPATPYIGQQFRPDGTNSVATIIEVHGTKAKPGVTYQYTHDGPADKAPKYSRPYAEVVSMAWDVAA